MLNINDVMLMKTKLTVRVMLMTISIITSAQTSTPRKENRKIASFSFNDPVQKVDYDATRKTWCFVSERRN